jgi:hypothetical protein
VTHRFATSKGRGDRYGSEHQRERRQRAARHTPADPCSRCGHPLGPMGHWLHLDHDEIGGYLGFSHGSRRCPVCKRRCNLRAGAQKGQRKASGARDRDRPRRPLGW